MTNDRLPSEHCTISGGRSGEASAFFNGGEINSSERLRLVTAKLFEYTFTTVFIILLHSGPSGVWIHPRATEKS